MIHKKMLVTIGALASVSLLLVGCGQSSPTNHSNKAAVSSSKTVKKSSNSSSTKQSALWNKKKDQELTSFINQWAPTMGQSYTKYDGNHDIRTKSGMYYPKDLSDTMVNGTHASIGWAPSGKGSYDYNVVALYNYDRPGNAATHITYAFAFHNGEPVALVDQSTNGTPDWTPTKNTDVSSNFAKIAGGQGTTSSSSSGNDSGSTSTSTSSSKVHLTGGQSSVDYITQKMGDQGWTVTGGTYGGAHGTPTDGSYIPYNDVTNDDGETYYVYQDGRIEKADD